MHVYAYVSSQVYTQQSSTHEIANGNWRGVRNFAAVYCCLSGTMELLITYVQKHKCFVGKALWLLINLQQVDIFLISKNQALQI